MTRSSGIGFGVSVFVIVIALCAPVVADGLIVDLDGKKGNLHLIEPSPKGYKELAQAKVLSGKLMWAPMAISQGKLLVRNQEEMKCLDLRNP